MYLLSHVLWIDLAKVTYLMDLLAVWDLSKYVCINYLVSRGTSILSTCKMICRSDDLWQSQELLWPF